MTDSTTQTLTITIGTDYSEDARVCVYLDPAHMEIYTLGGNGVPGEVYAGRHFHLFTYSGCHVESDIKDWIQGWSEEIIEISSLEGEERSDALQGILHAWEDGGAEGCSKYWAASDWCYGDITAVITAALECDTLEDAAGAEVDRGADNYAVIRHNDMFGTLQDALDSEIEELEDSEDEDDIKRVASIRRLLATA